MKAKVEGTHSKQEKLQKKSALPFWAKNTSANAISKPQLFIFSYMGW